MLCWKHCVDLSSSKLTAPRPPHPAQQHLVIGICGLPVHTTDPQMPIAHNLGEFRACQNRSALGLPGVAQREPIIYFLKICKLLCYKSNSPSLRELMFNKTK